MRYYKYLFFLVILLFAPLIVNATSGACSWHNGVDCEKGWQPNGKVYCNDGWTDSMVYYDYMIKCQDNNIDYELGEYLKQQRVVPGYYLDYQEEYNKCFNERSSSYRFIDAMGDCIDIARARSSVLYCPPNSEKYYQHGDPPITWCICNEGYYDVIGESNTCKMGTPPPSVTDILNQGIKELQKRIEEINYSFDELEPAPNIDYEELKREYMKSTCEGVYGPYSDYMLGVDGNKFFCSCKDGYTLNKDGNECVEIICNNGYLAEDNICYCNEGYSLSFDRTNCIKIPEYAHAVNSSTDLWLCDSGYREEGDSCIINNSLKEINNLSNNDQKLEGKKTVKDIDNNGKGVEIKLTDNKFESIKLFFIGLYNKLLNWVIG